MMTINPLFIIATILLICGQVCFGQSPNPCLDPNYHSLETKESARYDCGVDLQNVCRCERICYESRHRFVVNCTNAGFNNASILQKLPAKTEVLIMTGNTFKELDWNVFGVEDLYPHLQIIDLSNNAIELMHGKTFHHVKNVEMLILDFNKLSAQQVKAHPRVFSNFESLKELHLTNAFEDKLDKDLDEILDIIFKESNLTKLIKIHLEQNEITSFQNNRHLFCRLPSLLDIYLGDNFLETIDFDVMCLDNFRFLDLRRNKFRYLRNKDITNLDKLRRQKRNNSVQVDLTENPFECNCDLTPFIKWIKQTDHFLANVQHFKCKTEENKNPVPLRESKDCNISSVRARPTVSSGGSGRYAAMVLLCVLFFILISLICALIYIQRVQLRQKIDPVIETVHKRVRYTSIATGEAQENNL